ncbi:oocyte zinc finger protein XlCOF7.1 isoform X3 [Bombina bombina]|uniref:oocyte zinc finger protein XlCOF7.1 isoform X3 n=1 Tax=Bombina bombina TaxID=8345 RepID=UPI00235AF608|nr:oocyte zinc finger protein XlCOF7.1 isoform X3 [Bombina bombina]
MDKDVKKMTEKILNHTLEIIYLLTGKYLINSLIVQEVNKDQKQMTERIMNHVMEIIYLLTGEEYTVVKKTYSDSSIHQLIGEVSTDISIRCDDVAVCFPMEKWEYTEGRKELCRDMIENQQTPNTLGIPTSRTSGEDKTRNMLNIDKPEDICARKQLNALEHKICDMSTGEIKTEVVLNLGEREDECVRKQLQAPEEGICDRISTGEIKTEALLSDEQTEDLYVRSQLDVPDHDICDNVSTDKLHTNNHTEGATPGISTTKASRK